MRTPASNPDNREFLGDRIPAVFVAHNIICGRSPAHIEGRTPRTGAQSEHSQDQLRTAMSATLSAIRRLYELGQFGQIVKICSEGKAHVAGGDEEKLRIMFVESLLFSGHPQRA